MTDFLLHNVYIGSIIKDRVSYAKDWVLLADSAHKKLGLKDANHEVFVPNSKRLPKNNLPQLEAIKLAMTHSLSIIQGPPGVCVCVCVCVCFVLVSVHYIQLPFSV